MHKETVVDVFYSAEAVVIIVWFGEYQVDVYEVLS